MAASTISRDGQGHDPAATAGQPPAAGHGGVLVHRPVRAYPRPLPAAELTVAAPPTVGSTTSGLAGWLQYLVPLVGSGGSIAFLFAVPGPRPGWLVALVVGAAGASVLAGLGLRLVERRATRRARRRERARYLAHLERVALRADQLRAAQLAVAEHLHPDPPTLWATVDRTDRLWERRPGDADFLTVRVGRGPVTLAAPVRLDLPGDPLVEHDPELLGAAETLVRRASWLPDVPMTVPLRQLDVLALTGPPARARALARSLVCELAAFHAPDDLRILAAYPSAARPAWAWLRWLPHARDPSTPDPDAVDPSAGDPGARDPSTSAPDTIVPSARDPTGASGWRPAWPPVGTHARPDAGPHLVAILDATGAGPDTARPPGGLEGIARPPGSWESTAPAVWAVRGATAGELLERSSAAGVTLIWVAASTSGEPSELSMRVWLDDQGFATLLETTAGGRRVTGIRADAAGLASCEAIARRMAPLRLHRPPAAAARPGPVRLLDLLGPRAIPGGPAPTGPTGPTGPAGSVGPVGPVGAEGGDLSVGSRADLLRVPVGVTPTGEPLVLDLKEAAEGGIGPHGLVVGATGSGKSELLRTIVAGLAATHPSDQLAFVLVDFKGGAAFADLAPLPQVAGLITNLVFDLSMVDRAMAALQGELARRQRLLHQTGNQPDLRAYTARRAADPGLDPLPSLCVVVDEFGELLAARPEFLDLFTAIGRVGRSLGMHLLLASQRLDEGRLRGLDSHLRFRICLRTFSAAESTAVLGVPDAYHLPAAPGAALIKVDASPPVPFTAALVSTDRTDPGSPQPAATGPAGRRTDLELLVGGLARAGRPVHQVWLPPLAADIPLGPLLRNPSSGWLRVPVGVVDRPLDQVQAPLVLDLAGSAGHLAVVGAPRTGKSTLLATIVAALAATHPPDEVQAYAVDLGGGSLHRLSDLPHVGAVCGPREAERVHHLVRELRTLIAERERRFRDLGVDSVAAWHELRRSGLDLGGYGEVLLLIDNWAAFVRELPELEPEITELAAAGLHYGIHLVLAANRWAELRPGLRENLGGRLELRLNDPLESELGRAAAAALPELPGRGLTQAGLQFQVALPGPADAALERAMPGRDGAAAPRLRLLPTLVGEADLPAERVGGLPFAVEEHRLDTVWLDLFEGSPHLLVLGDAGCGKSSLLRLIARGLAARHPPDEVALLVVDPRRGLLDLATLPNLAAYACTPTSTAKAVDDLHRELTERTPSDPDLVSAHAPPAGSPDPGLRAAAAGSLANGSRSRVGSSGSGVAPGWRGPRYVLLVDDHDLLPAATGSPLLPLVDLLGLGRELGVHLVLTRRVAGAARASFEPVFQRLRELGGSGLVMSGDPGEGPLLAGQKAAPLPPGRGFWAQPRRPPALVQVAYSPPPPSKVGGPNGRRWVGEG
jgi:DNA segregation ATPase FtsK/SpoIIIE, S-DNA-T family